jgi:ribonuclease P protein component
MPIVTLKVRAEFQRVRGGQRASFPTFLLEAKARDVATSKHAGRPAPYVGPRFGLTITKKIGGAVQRNRMRRRLKDAIGRLQSDYALPGFDYVIVARGRSLDCPFDVLVADVRAALTTVHRPTKSKSHKVSKA